ncbi:MAG: hypothetical protein ACRDTC_02100, partial [Pseudonocardiaceae bacterium]
MTTGEVVLITDHSSAEGSRRILSTAVKRLVGAPPVCVDARHFMSGGTGRVALVREVLTMEVPADDLTLTPTVVLIYEIPPADRRRFTDFQRRLDRLGIRSLGVDVDAWRNATEKNRTISCFRRAGIPHMETITLNHPSLSSAVETYEYLGQDVWTRPLVGMAGRGVFHVTSHDQLSRVFLH